MYVFRPRFGMPGLGRAARKSQARNSESTASGPGGSARLRPLVAAVLVGSLALAACSSPGESLADGDEPARLADGADDVSASAGGGDASDDDAGQSGEELNFGDPAEAGFDAVQDIEQDPVALPLDAPDNLSAPEEIIPDIAKKLQTPVDGEEILDTVEVVDKGADVATDRDGRSRNSAGELAVLDEAANLACAHVEIALTHIDSGNDSIAIERIWSAADRAGSSTIATVQDWQEPLAAVIAEGEVSDLAPLIGFITVCAEGGYEL